MAVEPTPAVIQLARWRVGGIILLFVGAVVIGLGWPRNIDCATDYGYCDGTSGHWVAVLVGLILVFASMFPLAVQAAALGFRLQRQIEAEAEKPA